MNERKGGLIVIEGGDGAGKATQVVLLQNYLLRISHPFEVIDFPRYTENLYGMLVRRYLNGEFGSLYEVSPYLASLTYAGDRHLAKPLIEKWLGEGKLVVANRYVCSNKAHMAAKLSSSPLSRDIFITWLDCLEYQVNKIPREDLNIYLHVPAEVGQRNMEQKGNKDIHEADLKYQQQVVEIFLSLARREPQSWAVINCVTDGVMRERLVIHRDVIRALQERGILR